MSSIFATLLAIEDQLQAVQLRYVAVTAVVSLIVLLLLGSLVANVMIARRLRDLGDLTRLMRARHDEVVDALLHHLNTCAIELGELKGEVARYVTHREAQLVERKKLLQSIAGRLTASARGP